MKENEKKWRSFRKSELAHLYCPEQTLASALKNLREWIEHHPTLKQELEQTGYNPNSKRFTPLQVGLIFERLGEP